MHLGWRYRKGVNVILEGWDVVVALIFLADQVGGHSEIAAGRRRRRRQSPACTTSRKLYSLES
jgi:hypothetical protein